MATTSISSPPVSRQAHIALCVFTALTGLSAQTISAGRPSSKNGMGQGISGRGIIGYLAGDEPGDSQGPRENLQPRSDGQVN
jgi:hypothetical protein